MSIELDWTDYALAAECVMRKEIEAKDKLREAGGKLSFPPTAEELRGIEPFLQEQQGLFKLMQRLADRAKELMPKD